MCNKKDPDKIHHSQSNLLSIPRRLYVDLNTLSLEEKVKNLLKKPCGNSLAWVCRNVYPEVFLRSCCYSSFPPSFDSAEGNLHVNNKMARDKRPFCKVGVYVVDFDHPTTKVRTKGLFYGNLVYFDEERQIVELVHDCKQMENVGCSDVVCLEGKEAVVSFYQILSEMCCWWNCRKASDQYNSKNFIDDIWLAALQCSGFSTGCADSHDNILTMEDIMGCSVPHDLYKVLGFPQVNVVERKKTLLLDLLKGRFPITEVKIKEGLFYDDDEPNMSLQESLLESESIIFHRVVQTLALGFHRKCK